MDLKDFLGDENEKPLDRICTDGGFCGILRKIGCVGDSLSSGEFETQDADGKKHYHDVYDYSWGQYIARAAGCTAYNFSRGGMTAIDYCKSFAESKGFWNPELKCNAYIIAMGVNDLCGRKMPVGTVDDINLDDWTKNNQETFAGWYGQLVSRLKEIQPDAKFFFMTMPKCENEERNAISHAHREIIYAMAKHFSNAYVIDLYEYGPLYDADFRKKFYLLGHLNPAGYLLTGRMVSSYIDYIIRHNFEDFRDIGLMDI